MDKSLNRSIFKLAIPSTFTALVEPIISFTDKSVASGYNNDYISAISMNAVLLALLVWGCGSIRGVILNKTANLLGKNSLQKKSTEIGSIMLTGLLVTISLTFVAFLLFNFYLRLYDYSPELKEVATSYLHIRLLGVPLLIYMMFNSAFLRGKQNVTTPLLIALLVAVLNVIGDFTFPLFMSPLEGIAWASVFAQFIGVCIYFVVTRKDIHFSFLTSDLFNSDVLKSFSQSFLLFQRTILLHAVLFFYQWQISKYDIQYANEFNLLLETWLFTAFFLDGYGMAVASLGGLYQGQNNIEKLHLSFKRSSLWAAVTGVGLAGIIWVGQPLILKGVSFSEVSELFSQNYLLMMLSIPLSALAFVVDGICIGTGKNAYLRNLMFVGLLISIASYYAISTLWPSLSFYALWVSLIIWVVFRGKLIWGSYKIVLN